MNRKLRDIEEIVRFIERFQAKHGYPPTVRECGRGVGLSSPSTIHHHLETLYSQGRIKWEPAISRTLRVVR